MRQTIGPNVGHLRGPQRPVSGTAVEACGPRSRRKSGISANDPRDVDESPAPAFGWLEDQPHRRGEPNQPQLDYAVYAIKLRSRFRGIDVRSGVLLHGPAGWAEFSPFWDYDDAACQPWWAAAQEAAYDGWPQPRRSEVPVNCTVPAVEPDRVADFITTGHGCLTAKVKVAERGQELAQDADRVAAARDAVGPAGRIRVDANGGWDVDTARAALQRLDRAAGGLEYAEQPCRTVEELSQLRALPGVPVPIAADESIRRAEDPYRVAALEAADIAVLKVQPLGGVHACLEIAERIGIPVVVSSALETSVGLAAGVALAAALPELPYACGLATGGLLSADVVDHPVVPVDGVVPVGRPDVAPERLERVRADAELTASWLGRWARIRSATGEPRS